jgi:alpha-beta hydrolase superfamily lysophospholipase
MEQRKPNGERQMPPLDRQSSTVSRRAALAGAGLSLSGAIPTSAHAEEPAIWRHDYWAEKTRGSETIKLALYRKRLGAPHPGGPKLPILFLVHGSSIAALASWDLTVPGHGEYSAMNVFARLGYDVWTMDHEGYGKSDRTTGNSDIASSVADLTAAMTVITQETGRTVCHFMGESSGALRAGAFAMSAPQSVDRLILAALTYTGKGSPTLGKRAEQLAYYQAHNRRPRDRAMIESIFTRDKPGTTNPGVAPALANAELVYGDSVPTGTYLDMTAHLPVVDPTKITAPVCITRGEYDGIATNEDLWDFFRQLPNGDRQFVIIAHAAHALGTCRNRVAFWHTAQAFLSMPPAPPIG